MFLFALCLLLFGFSDAAIDPRSPGNVRSVLGKEMLIPCAVEPGIDWDADNLTLEKPDSGLKLNHQDTVQGRFFRSFNFQSVYWSVARSKMSDAGVYKCTVVYANGETDEKNITVTVLESGAGLRKQADGKCGAGLGFFIVECDALGAFPCCGRFGRCGYSASFCDCDECVDYRVTKSTPQ